jgi:uncharacterized BrkB/YihY/UPF0761 family membrane protein
MCARFIVGNIAGASYVGLWMLSIFLFDHEEPEGRLGAIIAVILLALATVTIAYLINEFRMWAIKNWDK